MRKILLISFTGLLFLGTFFLSSSSNSTATQKQFAYNAEYVPNEVLVKFKKDVGKIIVQNTLGSVQGKIITYLNEEIEAVEWNPDLFSLRSFRLDPDLLHVKVPEEIGTERAIYILNLNPNIEYAEKNAIRHVCEVPTDPEFYKQWSLHNIGPSGPAGGTEDADIDAPEAWDIFTGSSDIVVAVIDTGVDYNHEDFKRDYPYPKTCNIWTNEWEIPGNGKDDDYNGYVDDIYGWDWVNDDAFPMDDNDPFYHGTHCAGIIGAMANNGKGISGVCWNVKIMVLKAANEDGYLTSANIVQAIDYATENGAHLSNNSYGGYEPISSEYYAIIRARSAGKLFVAAAGNDGLPYPHYPARYDLDNIISVLATDHNDNLATYSNWGSEIVDLGAPGGFKLPDDPWDANDIYSTRINNHYQYAAGTSAATPFVAGAAALIWGRPVKIWWNQVKEIILDSTDYKSSLDGKCVTDGRLNLYEAIYEPNSPAAPSNLNAYSTSWRDVHLSWQDNSDNEIGFHIQRRYEGSAPGEYTTIGAVKENSTSFHDFTVEGGLTIYYKVGAYNLGHESPVNLTYTIPEVPPAMPMNLEGRSHGGEVELTWLDDANNEEGFKIQRKSEWDPVWDVIDHAGPNETEYYDCDVEPDTVYYYRVKAYNPLGDSYPSDTVRVYVR